LRDAADAAALLQAARDSEGTVLDDRGRTLINAAIDHLCRNPQGIPSRVLPHLHGQGAERCQDILEADSRMKADPVAKARAPDLSAETPVSKTPASGRVRPVELPGTTNASVRAA